MNAIRHIATCTNNNRRIARWFNIRLIFREDTTILKLGLEFLSCPERSYFIVDEALVDAVRL